MRRAFAPVAALILVILVGLSLAWGQHAQHTGGEHGTTSRNTDEREFVRFPDNMRLHTLANMRDHLLALQEIQEALARGQEDAASRIAGPFQVAVACRCAAIQVSSDPDATA